MSPRVILLMCLAACGLGGAFAAPAAGEGPEATAAAPSAAVAPADLGALSRRLDALRGRVGALVTEAERDPDEVLIGVYERYTHTEFKERKRAVRASMLVDYMADASKEIEVRRRAFKALADGPLRGDPDLSRHTKHGRMRERGYFATKHVVDLLRDDDLQTRVLADKLLKKWWHVVGISAIERFNPRNPKTGKPAVDAWKKELRRRK